MLSALCTPPWCRWDKANPPRFTIWLNLLYAFTAGFFCANLFYSHPILDLLARDFNVSQSAVASIPTLASAGDATGLLLIIPLADFIPRRHFTLVLCTLTMCFWLGLCITSNLTIFLLLTYLSACFTGVVQIMIPLVAELAAPESRAVALSIVGTGPTMAVMLARILSGIVAQYLPWRYVYYLSLALQLLTTILLFLFMPNYPSLNPPTNLLRTYPRIIADAPTLLFRHTRLLQCSLVVFATYFAVASFWTTLTFLLVAPPYEYTTLAIGLFGLIGAATLALGPLLARTLIKPLDNPLLSAGVGKVISIVGVVVGTVVGAKHVAGPVVQAVLLDAGLMVTFISCRMAVEHIEPTMRNRVNTALVTLMYLGSLSGTKAGNQVFSYGGWIAADGVSLAVLVAGVVVILLRGPNEHRVVGWKGGWRIGRRDNVVDDGENGDKNETRDKNARVMQNDTPFDEREKGEQSGTVIEEKSIQRK